MIDKLLAGFPYTTKEEWYARIMKDLKGKTVEDMFWSPDGELQINPYVHAEDVIDSLPLLSTFGTWAIGESFEITDEVSGNQQIHEALGGGTESLRISCTDRISWEKLLAGVELPLLHVGLQIEGDTQRALSDFFVYAQKQFPRQDLRVTVYSDNHSADAKTRFCIPPVQSARIVDGLVAMISQILDDTQGDPVRLEKQDLAIEIGMHYLVEIARLRALRILWEKIASVKGFTLSPHFVLEANTSVSQANEDAYGHMIRSTIMGVAAVVGGADRIYIRPATGSQHPESFYRHIARNIHHLLRYESKLTEISDPIAGAYYLDRLTRDIVNNVWELLPLQIKNSGR